MTLICLISAARCHYLSRLTCILWNKAKIANITQIKDKQMPPNTPQKVFKKVDTSLVKYLAITKHLNFFKFNIANSPLLSFGVLWIIIFLKMHTPFLFIFPCSYYGLKKKIITIRRRSCFVFTSRLRIDASNHSTQLGS